MRASVDLQLCEYPFYDLPDRFGRKPFAPAMVTVTAEQCAASESVTVQRGANESALYHPGLCRG